MRVLILGWYGTETIGDRAILAGIISYLNNSFDSLSIKLGSLYPFFSERTLHEDYSFYKSYLKKDIDIELFDSSKIIQLDKNIIASDIIIMGGGPLMDLRELHMIHYAFKKAKKLLKKTALLGCGIGPLFKEEFQKTVIEIVNYSDLVILRDSQSKLNLLEVYKKFSYFIKAEDILVSTDPSIEATRYVNNNQKNGAISLNLRLFPSEYTKLENNKYTINDVLINFVDKLSKKYSDTEINLIPMHYFHIGNDDREFLNKIAMKIKKDNIYVQNKNLSLEETMIAYQSSKFCIGMRYHSIVFQTLLNGKNYILDYTEPKKGKIYGFIKDIDTKNFYKYRYVNLQENIPSIEMISNINGKFDCEKTFIKNTFELYVNNIKRLGK